MLGTFNTITGGNDCNLLYLTAKHFWESFGGKIARLPPRFLVRWEVEGHVNKSSMREKTYVSC